MILETDHPVTLAAVDKWQGSQLDILQEECGELISAVSRFRRGRPGSERALTEEIGDVLVCLMSAIPMLDNEEKVQKSMQFKLRRLQVRMENCHGSVNSGTCTCDSNGEPKL